MNPELLQEDTAQTQNISYLFHSHTTCGLPLNGADSWKRIQGQHRRLVSRSRVSPDLGQPLVSGLGWCHREGTHRDRAGCMGILRSAPERGCARPPNSAPAGQAAGQDPVQEGLREAWGSSSPPSVKKGSETVRRLPYNPGPLSGSLAAPCSGHSHSRCPCLPSQALGSEHPCQGPHFRSQSVLPLTPRKQFTKSLRPHHTRQNQEGHSRRRA